MKIKFVNIWIVAGAAMLLFTGCEKFLTNDHPTAITDDVWWKTEANAYGALGSIYAGVPDGTSGRNVMLISGLSDEAVNRGDFRGNYDIFTRGLQNPTWDVAEWIWRDNYLDIRRACRFLENVDKCFMDSTLRERMKYEARALRAYYHMECLLYFGGIPIVTKSLTPTENVMKRNTAEEVYAFIESELNACGEKLPKEYVNDEAWRISSGTCYALLTRLAMYFKKYDAAKTAAVKVIGSGVYRLHRSSNANANSYAELFSYAGELNKERIWFRRDGCGSAWTTLAPYGIGGETYLSPLANVVDNYETRQGYSIQELGPDSIDAYRRNPNYKNNRDPRLTASVLYPGQSFIDAAYILKPFDPSTLNLDKIGVQKSTATGYWVRKYLDQRDRQGRSGTLDFMFIRYAEVLLNYVESLLELDDWQNPDIVAHLNDLRTRAGMPPVDVARFNTKDRLRVLIRRERQAELAFEGQRYFDIRRWGTVKAVMNGEVFGATDPATGQAIKVQDRAYTDRDYYWPIPEKEVLSNPNMRQNDGY
ncbi:RagB/SusD family nutrient uptake outer membrane protein [Chitinophaga lutea]|uniref:RagB/SusD family nutrient uptake outer membrane protein n=1 Tax=Chitinophaga lutea TaxID=2488634 RepID=A0A3N4PY77_9BACT|nr:RagB/SusD family nutrient uptake outer membrane protein [Chitinophaga lutea]RPE09027.1 RagB/SusD family nutrient uptake outer membrane protein [Chitinophaga lutea]